MTGAVGQGETDGCWLDVQTRDKMSNLCTSGNASIKGTSTNDQVTCQSTDKGDGSYTLHWRSKLSGKFEVHVLVENHHALGSPFHIKLFSTIPDLSKTVVTPNFIEDKVRSAK